MTILVPQLQKVQKEGDSGRKKINQWTRYLTVIVTIFQAGAYVAYLNSPGYAEAILPAYKAFFGFFNGSYFNSRYPVCNVAGWKNPGQRIG